MGKRLLRLALLTGASLVALAFSGQALAAFSAKVFASSTGGGLTTITYSEGVTDASPAKVQFLVPTGYSANLAGAPSGTVVGTVAAQAAAADLGGAVLPLAGDITVAAGTDSTSVANNLVPLAAQAMVCDGTPTPSAFLLLVLTAAGQTLRVPAYVDAIPAADPRSAFAAFSITFCLPAADLPASNPARASFGAKLIKATLSLKGAFVAPGVGETRWRMLATPYGAGTGKVDAAGTVEAQSLARTPQTLSFKAKGNKGKKTASLSGAVSEGGKGVAGATVTILAGGRAVGKAVTDGTGAFKATVRLKAAAATLQVRVIVAARDLGASACVATFSALGVPCVDATVAGFTLVSSRVRVRA